MGPKYDTCFFERYAMVSLVTLLGERFANLVNYDRPDLQDVERGLGIEVTRAINEDRLSAESLVNEMAGHDVFDINPDDLLRISQYGYAYGLQRGNLIGKLEYDYWSLALPLKRIIASKVRKVADGFYGDFKSFGLYIFSKENLNYDEVNLAMDYTINLQHDKPRRYSELYISQIQNLYVCNLDGRTISEYSVSQEQCRKFYRSAIGE